MVRFSLVLILLFGALLLPALAAALPVTPPAVELPGKLLEGRSPGEALAWLFRRRRCCRGCCGSCCDGKPPSCSVV